MQLLRVPALLFATSTLLLASEAGPEPQRKQSTATSQSAAVSTAEGTPITPVEPPKSETARALAAAQQPKADAAAKDAPKPPSPPVLPQVEVRKGRITELDQQLAAQEKAIAREKQNTKSSEIDKTLNDAKVARPLAIFGGESTQFRQHVANERVSLMEDEKDLIEAIAHAKTKEEKKELKKQLQILRQFRREMDKSLR